MTDRILQSWRRWICLTIAAAIIMVYLCGYRGEQKEEILVVRCPQQPGLSMILDSDGGYRFSGQPQSVLVDKGTAAFRFEQDGRKITVTVEQEETDP